jgi:acylphosphatase
MRLGLAGTARNQQDGTVRVVAEGDVQALQDLRDGCSEAPNGRFVERVDVEYQEPRKGISGFRMERRAVCRRVVEEEGEVMETLGVRVTARS